jgi:hypothetical protein
MAPTSSQPKLPFQEMLPPSAKDAENAVHSRGFQTFLKLRSLSAMNKHAYHLMTRQQGFLKKYLSGT